jgi:hypothetical protein
MSVKKIGVAWKRKQAKKVVKAAKAPLYRNRVMKGMDNVRGGPRFNLKNRSDTRSMNKKSKKKP